MEFREFIAAKSMDWGVQWAVPDSSCFYKYQALVLPGPSFHLKIMKQPIKYIPIYHFVVDHGVFLFPGPEEAPVRMATFVTGAEKEIVAKVVIMWVVGNKQREFICECEHRKVRMRIFDRVNISFCRLWMSQKWWDIRKWNIQHPKSHLTIR